MSQTQQQDETKDEALGFFDKPNNVKWILWVFYALCIVLVALDFVVHRHIYLDYEKIPTFYALYGFLACVLLVVAAKWLRLLIMRDEQYYDKNEEEKPFENEGSN